ncbi:hypothetical protein [Hymenobacter rubripertinctus]
MWQCAYLTPVAAGRVTAFQVIEPGGRGVTPRSLDCQLFRTLLRGAAVQ